MCLKACGYELMDLAHLHELKEPMELSTQSIILEALLRYAGFSHKLWGKADSFTSES